jgi:hypothetical protein
MNDMIIQQALRVLVSKILGNSMRRRMAIIEYTPYARSTKENSSTANTRSTAGNNT